MKSRAPEGILPQTATPGPRRANPGPLLLLTALLILGLTGLLGGNAPSQATAKSDAIELSVATPETLRSGMIFETVVQVSAAEQIDELVIGVSDTLWREITINTMIPAAESENFADGYRRFTFTDLEPGDVFRFKIDGQINPPLLGDVHGEIAAFDGERKLTSVMIRTRVLP